jgi:hypothetical protein
MKNRIAFFILIASLFFPTWTHALDMSGGGGGHYLTTKGDIHVFSTTNTRLPVGANGYVITADSTEATGLKWAAAGVSYPLLAPDGSASAPSYSFSGATTVGLYKGGLNLDADLFLIGSAGVLSMRNGTTGQAFDVYSTYTSGSVYKRTRFGYLGTIDSVIDTQGLLVHETSANTNAVIGSSSDTPLSFVVNGQLTWQALSVVDAYTFRPFDSNLRDIGDSTHLVKSIYVGTSIIGGGSAPKLDLVGSTRTTGSSTSVLTGSIDATASTAVVGIGTLFTTELVVGDRITVTGETRTVTVITDATNLTVDTAFTDTANDTSPDKLAAIQVWRKSDGTVAGVINDLGYVGIGTAAPSQFLHLHSPAVNSNVLVQTNNDVTGWSFGIRGDVSDNFIIRHTGIADRFSITTSGNIKIAGTANRATTEGTNHLDIFDGTAPVGTLANGVSLYSTSGELYAMDAAGNASLQSPHNKKGEWIFLSKNTVTGKVLRIDMERMMKVLNEQLGGGFIDEYMEPTDVILTAP